MKKLSIDAHNALHRLAIRFNSDNVNHLNNMHWLYGSVCTEIRCLICGHKLGDEYEAEIIRDHGLQHLKEHNLLALL